MKRLLFSSIFFVLLAFMFASCATQPPQNYFRPFAATNNPVGSKVGEALDSEGGILQAAQNGGITKIATVDIKYRFERGEYKKAVVVSGE